MPVGPGKYNEACTVARLATEAQVAVLIVLGGKHGSGFSLQADSEDAVALLPDVLRQLADEIERSRED